MQRLGTCKGNVCQSGTTQLSSPRSGQARKAGSAQTRRGLVEMSCLVTLGETETQRGSMHKSGDTFRFFPSRLACGWCGLGNPKPFL